MAAIVLPLTYFGNLSYFKYIIDNDEVWIDDKEAYLKQTFRNRTILLAANGTINLSIPIYSTKGQYVSIDKIKVSYDDPWQLKHWRTIKSAYKSAPFFEEYEEEIHDLIMKKHSFLLDLNKSILEVLMKLLDIRKELKLVSNGDVNPLAKSYLGYFKPSKMPVSHLNFTPYLQVFNYKFGFVPNLSILDLLFNEGPYSTQYLSQNSNEV